MKIATWNIERLKRSKNIAKIIEICKNVDAEILVLTEYDERVQLKNYPHKIATKSLFELDANFYKKTERRVVIYSKYEITNQLKTYDEFTSCCGEINTEIGKINVYGTIIGVFGNRNENFKTELSRQLLDYEKYSKDQNFCVIGDFNISFSDNYYFTEFGRKELNHFFEVNKLKNLTKHLSESIDHIAISDNFLEGFDFTITELNSDKKLSDHKGVSIQFINLKSFIEPPNTCI